jgi:hypothetical protein
VESLEKERARLESAKGDLAQKTAEERARESTNAELRRLENLGAIRPLEKVDAAGKRLGERLQKSRDRKLEKSLNALHRKRASGDAALGALEGGLGQVEYIEIALEDVLRERGKLDAEMHSGRISKIAKSIDAYLEKVRNSAESFRNRVDGISREMMRRPPGEFTALDGLDRAAELERRAAGKVAPGEGSAAGAVEEMAAEELDNFLQEMAEKLADSGADWVPPTGKVRGVPREKKIGYRLKKKLVSADNAGERLEAKIADYGEFRERLEARLRKAGKLEEARDLREFENVQKKYRRVFDIIGRDVAKLRARNEALWRTVSGEVERLYGDDAGDILARVLDDEMLRRMRAEERLYGRYLGRERTAEKRLSGKLARAEEKLSQSRSELERVRRGDLTDAEWGKVSQDPSYMTRAWDIRAICTRTVEFVERIADWLVRREGLEKGDADAVAYAIKDQILGNSYARNTGPLKYMAKIRGIENRRTLDIPSAEIMDFLVRDPAALFQRMVNTVVPDFHIKMRLGTLGTAEMERAIGGWYNGEIAAGRMESALAQKHLRTDTDALRTLVGKLRHTNALSGDALWMNRNVTALLSFNRSVASAVMLGALPSTALMDCATILVSMGFGQLFLKFIPNLIRYFIDKEWRIGIEADLRSLGLFVDCCTAETTGRLADAYGDPTLGSRIERVGKKLSNFSHKFSGAEAVLGAVHHVAAHCITLDIWRLAEKLSGGGALALDELQNLNIARLDESRLKKIGAQIREFGLKDSGLKRLNLEDWTDATARRDAIYAVNQLLDIWVLNPGFEAPTFGPMGKLFFQFKMFLFAAVDRCLIPTAQKLSQGNYQAVARLLGMVALGGFRDLLNRAVDGREMPTPEEFIIRGIAASDVLPFVGDLVKSFHDSFDANGLLNTAANDLGSFFIPPAVSFDQGLLQGANGILKLLRGEERPTRREAGALKRSILFNNHYLFRRFLHRWKEALSEPRN